MRTVHFRQDLHGPSPTALSSAAACKSASFQLMLHLHVTDFSIEANSLSRDFITYFDNHDVFRRCGTKEGDRFR